MKNQEKVTNECSFDTLTGVDYEAANEAANEVASLKKRIRILESQIKPISALRTIGVDAKQKKADILEWKSVLGYLEYIEKSPERYSFLFNFAKHILKNQIERLEEEEKLPCFNVDGPFLTLEKAAFIAQRANCVLEEEDLENAAERGEFRTWIVDNNSRYMLWQDLLQVIRASEKHPVVD